MKSEKRTKVRLKKVADRPPNVNRAAREAGSVRRVLPVPALQVRSRERVLAMLAEAERAIAEGGVAALSLPRVAAGIGVPRAAVYRHFPGPDAMLLALAEKYLAEREQLIALAWGRARLWRRGLEKLVEAAADYYRQRPAARAVLLHWSITPEVAAAHRATVDRLAVSLRELFEGRAGVPVIRHEPDPYLIAVEMVSGLFSLSERRHRQITDAYCAEAVAAVEAYLASCFDQVGSAPGAALG